MCLTAMSFQQIIDEVRARPELWCRDHKAFKQRAIQKKVWEKIAKKLRLDETLLKKRWKHLKDQYRKELKKPSVRDKIDPISSWHYFEPMEFLRDELLHSFVKTENRTSDDTDEDNMEAEDKNANSVTNEEKPDAAMDKLKIMSRRISRLNGLVESHIKECNDETHKDPDMMFLMSLLPTMQRLNDIQKLQFRGKVNEWLLEAVTQDEYAQVDSKFFVQAELNTSFENE